VRERADAGPKLGREFWFGDEARENAAARLVHGDASIVFKKADVRRSIYKRFTRMSLNGR
jgi:hypothetical protein